MINIRRKCYLQPVNNFKPEVISNEIPKDIQFIFSEHSRYNCSNKEFVKSFELLKNNIIQLHKLDLDDVKSYIQILNYYFYLVAKDNN